MIKIQPSGDYVQLIYVDPVGESVQQELKSDTDAFECSYDSDGKLFMQFGAMRFENPDPTDFTINGSAVADAADFISKLNALFTGGSSGSSFLPVTGTGTATGNITGDLNGHNLLLESGGLPRLFANVADPANESAGFSAFNTDGDGNSGQCVALVTATSIQTYIESFYQDGLKDAKINLYANATESEIELIADKYNFPNLLPLDFANDGAAASGGVEVGGLYHTSGAVKIRLS